MCDDALDSYTKLPSIHVLVVNGLLGLYFSTHGCCDEIDGHCDKVLRDNRFIEGKLQTLSDTMYRMLSDDKLDIIKRITKVEQLKLLVVEKIKPFKQTQTVLIKNN